MQKEPHGIKGHLNIFVKDHDSFVTGNGVHSRVIVCEPSHGEIYCRVDHVHDDLRSPTDTEIEAVVKNPFFEHKRRWRVKSRIPWDNGKREDVTLV